MPASILNSTAPIRGVEINNKLVRVTNRTGGTLVEGDLAVFDLTLSDGDVTNYVPGDAASAFANIITPVITDRDVGLFCVVDVLPVHLTSIANDKETGVWMWGRDVKVQVENLTAGTIQGPDASNNGDVCYAPKTTPFDAAEVPDGATVTLDAGARRLCVLATGETLATTLTGVVKMGIFDGWGDMMGVHHFGAIGS